MKKLIGHTGDTTSLSGRRRFANDDLQALQEQFTLGVEKQFIGKGAYVIAGGAVSGSTGNYKIEPALVFINGKLIEFEGRTGYAITANTKLVEDTAQLTSHRLFDLVSEEKPGIISSKLKLTEDATVTGESIKLTAAGFARTYEGLLAQSLYPDIYKRASINILPLGSIMMWGGSIEKFDNTGKGKDDLDGWALCNGVNGTIDLRARFIVGYDPQNSDYNKLGSTGGFKEVNLTVEHLPRHRHVSDISPGVGGLIKQSTAGSNKTSASADATNSGTEPNIIDPPVQDNEVGNNQPHENRPPYYTVAFIQKISVAPAIWGSTGGSGGGSGGGGDNGGDDNGGDNGGGTNPCGLKNEQILGTWNVTGQTVIVMFFNGKWWVCQVSTTSPLALIVRGRNFVLRTDFTPASSLPLQSCLAPEETALGGLAMPASFTLPEGWEFFTVDSTTLIRRKGTGGGDNGGDSGGGGVNESITFEVEVI